MAFSSALLNRGILTAVVFYALFNATGCAGKADVSGSVTYQNKKVVWGTVTLVAADNIAYNGRIELDGTFRIQGVKVGPAKVGVFSPNPDRSERDRRSPLSVERPSEDGSPPKPEPGKWFELPDKFVDPAKSGVIVEVKPGQPIAIELK